MHVQLHRARSLSSVLLWVSQPVLQVQVPVLLVNSPGALEALRPRQQQQDSSAREQHQVPRAQA